MVNERDVAYDQGVADSAEPGTCDLVEAAIAQSGGSIDAARTHLAVAAMAAFADSKEPFPPFTLGKAAKKGSADRPGEPPGWSVTT